MCYTLLPTQVVSRLIIITRNSEFFFSFFFSISYLQMKIHFNKSIFLLFRFSLLYRIVGVVIGTVGTLICVHDYILLKRISNGDTNFVDSHRFGFNDKLLLLLGDLLLLLLFFSISIKNAWLKWLNQLS